MKMTMVNLGFEGLKQYWQNNVQNNTHLHKRTNKQNAVKVGFLRKRWPASHFYA